MDTTLFYVLGIALVLSALAVSALGLRNEGFPQGRAFLALVGCFALLTVATMTFAVLNSRAESDKTEHNREAAAKLQAANAGSGVQEADQPSGESGGPSAQALTPSETATTPAAQEQTLKVRSPETGALQYLPATLEAKAGAVTIQYQNPSPVPHSIAIQSPDGQTIDASDIGANGDFSVSADLAAGTYTYYCTVPGHREAGMEGKLTVK
jgi:plastocyanin